MVVLVHEVGSPAFWTSLGVSVDLVRHIGDECPHQLRVVGIVDADLQVAFKVP